MPTLQIIVASTRPGRVGLPVADWFAARAQAHGAFELDVVDLAELGLPFMDEPNHPRLRRYEHQHTRNGAPASTPPTPSCSSRPSTTTASTRR